MTPYGNIKERMEFIKSHEFFNTPIENLKTWFEREKNTEPQYLSYSDFMIFFNSGSRKEYEKKYFDKRTRLGVSAMLYLLYGDKQYLDDAVEVIWSICSEHCWTLPAHCKNVCGGKYYNELDLFASETGYALAEIYHLLGNALPENIKSIIKSELEKRVFSSFENGSFWWENVYSNWASVCAGSVGCTYLLMDPERFNKVKDRINKVIKQYVDGFCDDGCTTEGVGYWGYGFSFYIFYAETLKRVTGEDILHSDKLHLIINFPTRMHLRKNYTVSFSDASRTTTFTNLGLLSYLKSEYPSFIMPPNVALPNVLTRDGKLLYIIKFFTLANPEHYTKQNEISYGFDFFPDAGWYISKKPAYSFAAKGGHNDEEHNHNDVGSFMLVTDDGFTLTDLGSMEYTRATFTPSLRYVGQTEASSLSHSVPIYKGQPQLFGKDYKATVIEANENNFTLEIQGAYGKNLPRITRSFELLENKIILRDNYEEIGEGTVERFALEKEPIVTREGIRVGSALIKSKAQPKISSKTYSNHSAQPETFWFADYPVTEKSFELEITVK